MTASISLSEFRFLELRTAVDVHIRYKCTSIVISIITIYEPCMPGPVDSLKIYSLIASVTKRYRNSSGYEKFILD